MLRGDYAARRRAGLSDCARWRFSRDGEVCDGVALMRARCAWGQAVCGGRRNCGIACAANTRKCASCAETWIRGCENWSAGQFDAIVLACAGLQRLGLTERITEVSGHGCDATGGGTGRPCASKLALSDVELTTALAELDDHGDQRVRDRGARAAGAAGGRLPGTDWARGRNWIAEKSCLKRVSWRRMASESVRESARGPHERT